MWRRCLKLPNFVPTRILVAICTVQYCISANRLASAIIWVSLFIVHCNLTPFPTKIMPLRSEIQS